MKTVRQFLSLAAVTLALGACASHKAAYSFNNVHATPLSPMVASKIARPLYIVLDPSKVKSSYDLKETSITDFDKFVSRDLKQAMEAYFTTVVVVKPGDALPAEPFIAGDVKVDRVQLHSLQVDNLEFTVIEMQWAFAMRPSEAADYAYTFAGTAKSSGVYKTFEEGCAQLTEDALATMQKGFVEKNVMQDLARLPTGPAAAEPPKPI